jgi:hypothetical protein
MTESMGVVVRTLPKYAAAPPNIAFNRTRVHRPSSGGLGTRRLT